MTVRSSLRAPIDVEVVGAATGCAVIAGALAFLLPSLVALTGALAAIGVAGFVARLRASGSPPRALVRPGPLAALAIVGAAGAMFLLAPDGLAPARGLLLGVAMVPLALVARRATPRDRPGRGR